MNEVIRLRGVRVHNLKNIDLDIPVNALTVITGPSGSGKSSLAFDTLYAEGRRRFVQSLSSYARQFLERIERPEADIIESIFPAIAIQQKNQITGSRSTVGTITETYDYLRLLFARVGVVRCPDCRIVVQRDTVEDVISAVEKIDEGKRIWICFAPLENAKSTVYLKKGYIRAISTAGEPKVINLESLSSRLGENLAIVVDRLVSGRGIRERVAEGAEAAFREGNGCMSLLVEEDWRHFDTSFRCSSCRKVYLKPEPRLFSFNNPYGACPRCRGFGDVIDFSMRAVIPDSTRTLQGGAIEPWRKTTRKREREKMLAFAEEHNIPLDIPWKDLSNEHQRLIVDGGKGYGGIRGFFARLERKKYKMHIRVLLSRYRGYSKCPECGGSRLRTEAQLITVGKHTIGSVTRLTIQRIIDWLDRLKFSPQEAMVVERVMDELQMRLHLLKRLGVGYLSMNRRAQTLSGGEIQRINLATALGGGLIGTLFVLDEPTIGLHERDTARLIEILKSVRDLGNTVVVVEHDARIMAAADHIIDLGPGAGRNGGEVVYTGAFKAFLKDQKSSTSKYLSGRRTIPVIPVRRKDSGLNIRVSGACDHNLKNVTVDFPLNVLTCVTGVSGSGKSTLVHDVLYANIMASRKEWQKRVGECDSVTGHEELRQVVMVDQGAIGRSPRSNPITYIKAFSEIRNLFAERYQAKVRGYTAAEFSFNVKGGRCDTCQGNGEIAIEMQFLPDVQIKCEDCGGKRYKREVLDVRYKGLNIHEVLQLSVEEALEHFRDYPSLIRKLSVLDEVGLGYLQLGQSATTLSGGEAQRIKLAYHMSRTDVSGCLYLFDEPTTGLHFADIKKLLNAFRRLVFHGASVIVIEHNMDVIKNADWIIDLGPEGGDKGGWIVATGTPEQVAEREGSFTGKYLRPFLESGND